MKKTPFQRAFACSDFPYTDEGDYLNCKGCNRNIRASLLFVSDTGYLCEDCMEERKQFVPPTVPVRRAHSPHPTLGSIVPFYTELGWSKKVAVKMIVADRLFSGRLPGKGNRANRRIALIQSPVQPRLTEAEIDAYEQSWRQEAIWATVDQMNRQILSNRQQWAAAVASDTSR